MIEINLIPGNGTKAKKGRGGGGGASVSFGASFANLKSKVRDPYMLGAIGSAIVAILVTGGLYSMQEPRRARLLARVETARHEDRDDGTPDGAEHVGIADLGLQVGERGAEVELRAAAATLLGLLAATRDQIDLDHRSALLRRPAA